MNKHLLISCFYVLVCTKDRSLIKEMTSKTKEQFLEFYPELLQQLKSSPVLQELPDMQKWIEKVDFTFQL